MFPCNCRPPFPRPEPFSPLPRPGTVPDWGKWIRDRLAEKGALLAFPTRTTFPSAGSAPNLYLAEDTGVVYRWGGEGYAVLVDPSSDVETYPGRSVFPGTGRSGVIYVDASANLLYRWDETGYVLLTSDLSGVESRLADVESKVPAQATAQNQLADKAFVNSSIATNTAFYISDNGRPFQSLADLENYEGALTNNDYAFVVGRDAAGNTTYTRYKWNEATEAWAEEYVLNNSSFTAEQWAAVSSGITSGLVAKLGALPTAEALAAALAGKQDKLTFETSVVKESSNPVTSSGIWAAIWGTLAPLPTGFTSLYDWCVGQLAGKATKGDATLAPRYADEWIVNPVYPEGYTSYTGPTWSDLLQGWVIRYHGDSSEPELESLVRGAPRDALSLSFSDGTTATRQSTEHTLIGGYVLGLQTDKPLASEAEAEALRNGKLDKSGEGWYVGYTGDGLRITDTAGVYYIDISPDGIKTDYPGAHNVLWPDTGGTLALLENLTGKFSSSTAYAKDALVVYFGALYRCVNPNGHAGAWVAADFTVATVEDVLAALRTGKADKPATFTTGNLAKFDENGNPTDSGIKPSDKLDSTSAAPAFNPARYYDFGDLVTKDGILYQCEDANVAPGSWDPTSWGVRTVFDIAAKKGDIPYSFGDPIVIESDAVQTDTTDPDNPINYAEVTLADRTANIVQIYVAIDELRVTLPAATDGKVRDFGLTIGVGDSTTALAAPALAIYGAEDEDIGLANPDGAMPELADGTATTDGLTVLYFSEFVPYTFLVKGEQVQQITQ